jgi:CHAD domain-containing protein
MSTGEAARAVIRVIFDHLRANQSGAVLGNDPEHVHQMRVAVRRLRCALRMFDKAGAGGLRRDTDAALRLLGCVLGRKRDLDVALPLLAPLIARLPAADATAVRRRFGERTAAAHARMRAHFQSPAYARLTNRLALWLAAHPGKRGRANLSRFARHAMASSFAAIAKRAAQPANLGPEARHQLRIKVKRARYANEFLGDLYPGAMPRLYGEVLGQLQERLGGLTDVNMARALLRDLGLEAELERVLAAGLQVEFEADGAWQRDFETVHRLAGFWKHRKARRNHV